MTNPLGRPPHSLWVFFETIVLYGLTSVGLSLLKFKKLYPLISHQRSFHTQSTVRLRQISRYTVILNRLLKKKANPLRDSLVLFWAAQDGKLKVGLKENEKAAWVECQGLHFFPPVDCEQYQVIFTGLKNEKNENLQAE